VNDVLTALSEAYGYWFRDIIEYFQFVGVIPAFILMEETTGGRTILKVNPRYSEREIAAMTITSMIGGAKFDDLAFKALLRLLGGEG
jgi:hypothetical protein